ncbi:uncharacterized protein LOC135481954 isoform X2 [Liolophura sinensis]
MAKKNKGLFGSLLDSADRTVNALTKEVDRAVGYHTDTTLLQLFQTQNVVQLVSRSNGQALQIVMSQSGQPVVDGLGAINPHGHTIQDQPFNTLWTVINEGKNQVRLHNNNNYLAIVNGNTIVMNIAPGTPHGVESKFQLYQVANQFVTLESCKEYGRHVGILPNGTLKPALATGKDLHGQFGVRLVFSPYGSQPPITKPK